MEKIALITGSSSGIGLLTAVTLARRGYRVVATMPGLDLIYNACHPERGVAATSQRLSS